MKIMEGWKGSKNIKSVGNVIYSSLKNKSKSTEKSPSYFKQDYFQQNKISKHKNKKQN